MHSATPSEWRRVPFKVMTIFFIKSDDLKEKHVVTVDSGDSNGGILSYLGSIDLRYRVWKFGVTATEKQMVYQFV